MPGINLNRDVQRLAVGEVVDLYEIDTTVIGFEEIIYWTPSNKLGTGIIYGGKLYSARAVEITAVERSSVNEPPEVTLTITNVDKGGNSLLLTYRDLIGAKITKRRTFSKYLDFLADGVTVNPNASTADQFIPEVWYVQQKKENSRVLVSWSLSAITKIDNQQIPRRRVLKTVCERRYRYWDGAQLKYFAVSACPYSGAGCWDRYGVATTPDKDECDKSDKGCALRFPDGLPTWAFPGVSIIPSS